MLPRAVVAATRQRLAELRKISHESLLPFIDADNDLVTEAQQTIVRNAYVVPVVELQTELGVSPKVHDLAFEVAQFGQAVVHGATLCYRTN